MEQLTNTVYIVQSAAPALLQIVLLIVAIPIAYMLNAHEDWTAYV